MVVQDLEIGLFTCRFTTVWKLLHKIALPVSEGPYLIIQLSVNFWFRKLLNVYRVIYPLVVK